MPETTRLPATDPRTQAVPSGLTTTEFWVSALSILGLIVGAVIDSGLVPEGTVWFKILGIAGTVLIALGYTWNRTILKRDVAKGASDVAVAQVEAAAPKKPGAGFVGESLVGTEVDVDDRPNAHRSEIGFTGRVRP